MSHEPNRIYEFGPFRLEGAEHLLLRNGEAVPLQPKAFELLLVLVKRHGHLLGKDELLKAIWPDTVVEEVNLANNISILRKTLGAGVHGQRFIETVPRRGYRFVAPVRELIGDDRKLLAKRYTDNFEVYQLYVKGHFFWDKRTEEGIKKSIEYFEQAIKLDPNYAPAYAGLAVSYVTTAYREMVSPADAGPRAEAAARKALEIDEQLGQAHSALGVLHFRNLEWSEGVRAFQRAIDLNPSYSTAHMWHSYYLMALGRFDEAVAEAKRALELEPLSLIINTQMGTPFFYMRQYDRAIEQYQKALEMDPQFPPARYWLGRAYTQKGAYSEAIEVLWQTVAANPRLWAYITPLAYAHAVSGQRSEAVKLLDELREQAKQRSISAYYIALIYAGLGEKDQAFVWLEKAYRENADGVIFLNVEPGFDGLRSDPRFHDLLRHMRLAQGESFTSSQDLP
jgi:DNA-binding winged helix-turn-helix (wHTH) protein/Flp pilus assembly protein TadD